MITYLEIGLYNGIRMKTYWNRVDPYSNMAGLLIKQAERDNGRRMPQDNRGRDWSAAAASQGMPRIHSHRQLGRGMEGFYSGSQKKQDPA